MKKMSNVAIIQKLSAVTAWPKLMIVSFDIFDEVKGSFIATRVQIGSLEDLKS